MKEIPTINVWITFIIYSIVTLGWTLYASFNILTLIMDYPLKVLGSVFGYWLAIYYLMYVPSRVMWDRIKLKNENENE